MIEIEIVVVLLGIVVAFVAIAYYAAWHNSGRRRLGDAKEQASPPQEPIFGGAPPPSRIDENAPPPVLSSPDPLPELPSPDPLPELPSPDESLLTMDICYVIRFYGDDALPVTIFQPLVEKLGRLGMPMSRMLAYNEEAKKWKVAAAMEKFHYWLLAMPLANRGGRLTAEKIAIIEEDARNFIDDFPMRLAFPPASETLKNAGLLDDFCNAVDMVLELRVDFPATVDAGDIAEAIQTLPKMDFVGEGRHEYRQDSELLFVANHVLHAGRGAVVLSLDAPRITTPERAFDRMADCAKRLATLLGGAVTDPVGKAIDEERLSDIRQQLELLRRQMNEYGVPPGSAIARILFS